MRRLLWTLVILGSLLAVDSACAEDVLTREEALALVSGSRYSGRSSKFAFVMKASPDGTLISLHEGGPSHGSWNVNDKGELCYQWLSSNARSTCGFLRRTEDPNVFTRSNTALTFEPK